jgi:hypothetical protein
MSAAVNRMIAPSTTWMPRVMGSAVSGSWSTWPTSCRCFFVGSLPWLDKAASLGDSERKMPDRTCLVKPAPAPSAAQKGPRRPLGGRLGG